MYIIIIVLNVALLLFMIFLVAYFKEKGKHLAAKEDIESLVGQIEKIRMHYQSEIEQLKASLEAEKTLLLLRRRLYKEICTNLRVFLIGADSGKDEKDAFLKSFSESWLWASDPVVAALRDFSDIQIKHVETPGSVNQAQMKEAFSKCILEMRKDAGFSQTTMAKEDFRFLVFKG